MININNLPRYSGAWTEKQLRHLLIRTLFGVTEADMAYFKGKSMDECIEILLRSIPLPGPPMYRLQEDPDIPPTMSLVLSPYNKIRDEDWTIFLKSQWVSLMVNPEKNIREKMVLFWHNHFVIQFAKVADARYHYLYLNTLRKHVTGNFKTLLKEISISPGMLVYLNGNLNSSRSTNENYGRELQELFTVGKGNESHYTEGDVKAASKVLTGWKDDKKRITSFFDEGAHSTDDKKFSPFYNNHIIKGKMGANGAQETDELIDMICNNHEVAKFICRKFIAGLCIAI